MRAAIQDPPPQRQIGGGRPGLTDNRIWCASSDAAAVHEDTQLDPRPVIGLSWWLCMATPNARQARPGCCNDACVYYSQDHHVLSLLPPLMHYGPQCCLESSLPTSRRRPENRPLHHHRSPHIRDG